jgi:hypothetical protein
MLKARERYGEPEMDSVVRQTGPDMWAVESIDGIMLGGIEKQGESFVVIPSPPAQLADLDPLPYISLETAMAGIAAHLQGTCRMADP